MLKEQHRMAPDIRKLVSQLTYENLLTDADSVESRPCTILQAVNYGFPSPLKSRVVLIKHAFLEKRVITYLITN